MSSDYVTTDIPADKCPACGKSMREHDEEYARMPRMNDDGTEVGSGGAVMVTLGLVAFVVLIVLAVVAIAGP